MTAFGGGLLGESLLGGDPPESDTNYSVGVATVSGSLVATFALASDSAGVSTGSADLTVTAPAFTDMDGVAHGVASAAAHLGVERPLSGSSAGRATGFLIPQPVPLAGFVIAHAHASGVLTVNTSSPGTTNPLVLPRFEPTFDLGGAMTTIPGRPLLFT